MILSGQVRVNGHVVTELGTKADPDQDRIEAAGRTIESEERRVYLLMNKPPEVMSTLADPEGRKTLKNLLRGFPSRVYPVGNLEYAATGLIFLTNDGDLAAELLKKWEHLEQIYYVKIKGMLTLTDLERVGKEAGVKMQTLRQPGAARGHGANYWYEVTMRDSKLESLRRVLFREKHPMEKLSVSFVASEGGADNSCDEAGREEVREPARTDRAETSEAPFPEARALSEDSPLC